MPKSLVAMPFFILVTLGLFQAGEVSAGEYSYKHYTVLDGLPQNQIITLFQDSKGYIWIGTKGGVSRFDGTAFKNFTVNEGLLANHILRIFEDQQGRILFYSYLGLDRLEQDTIVNVFLSDTISPQKKVFFVTHAEGVEYWFLDKKRFCIHPGDDYMNPYELPSGLAHDDVSSLFFAPDRHKLWIQTEKNGLYSVSGEKVTHFRDIQKGMMLQLKSGELVIVNIPDVYTLDTNSGQIDLIASLNAGITCVPQTKFNDKIYCLVDWEFIDVVEGAKVTRLEKKFNFINDILIDREGHLWVATETGLYRRISDAFENFTPETGSPEYVWSIVEDRAGAIWLASYGNGLSRLEKGRIGKISGYLPVYPDMGGKFFYTGAKMLSDGALYFPVRGKGILRYSEKGYELLGALPPVSAMDIVEDTVNSQLVIATVEGVLAWKDQDHVQTLFQTPSDSRKLIKSLAIDKDGRYWMGGEYLLMVYDGQQLIQFPNEQDSYNAGAVAIFADSRQNIWLGTTSGLYIYDFTSFRRVAQEQIKSQVSSFAELDNRTLVMGVSEGLVLLNLQDFYDSGTVQLEILDASRGFLGFDCIRNGILRDQHNNIWVAASDRVIKFYPGRLRPDTVHPAIRIEKLAIDGSAEERQEILFDGDVSGQPHDWSHRIKNVRIDYHAIHFQSPENITYTHRLLGYSPEWSTPVKERYVSYTNLIPGTYTFEVVAFNSDGLESREPATVKFGIVPAFWQMISFRIAFNILITILVLLLGYLVLNYFRRRKEQREIIERKISELQLKTIRSQMDPHFTFNALNTIGSVIYKENKEKAYRYLTRFSRLIRSSLDVSDKITRTLEEEIEFTLDYLELEKIRFRDGFKYTLDVEEDVDKNWQVPKMILQNYAENAVKHGLKHKPGDRKLWIRIRGIDGSLSLTVEDNGVGRKAAAIKKEYCPGKGLKIMGEIYDLYLKLYKVRISQTIEDIYGPEGEPAGTRVILEVPRAGTG